MSSISLIVPNYNGSRYLLDCIESILSSGIADLQLIVIDGGSDDGSLDIIRSFEGEIDWWVSEQDSGQSEAINKGFARATGNIVNWLCSDDFLKPGALKKVQQHFAKNPHTDVLVGACETLFTQTGKRTLWNPEAAAIDYLPCINPCPQPSTFYRRSLLDRNPPLREDFHYAMDFEFWNSLKADGAHFSFTNEVFSVYRMTGENKTSVGGDITVNELWQILETYHLQGSELRSDYQKMRMPLDLARRRHPSKLFWRLTTPFYKIATWRLAQKYDEKTIEYLSRQILRFAAHN